MPRAYITGAITIGGVAVSTSGAFANPSGGASIPIAPGTYRVYYRQQTGGGYATQLGCFTVP